MGLFSQHGLDNLGRSLRFGAGGLDELLRRRQLMYDSKIREGITAFAPAQYFSRAATDYALRVPWFALTVKWFFYLSAGFLMAAAVHVARTGAGAGGAVARARISCLPRNTICVGLFACGPASERAVSRPGKPEGRISPSAALARAGQRSRRRGVQRHIEDL